MATPPRPPEPTVPPPSAEDALPEEEAKPSAPPPVATPHPKRAATTPLAAGTRHAPSAPAVYQRTHANVAYVVTQDAEGWHWQIDLNEISDPYPTRHEAELAAEAVIAGT